MASERMWREFPVQLRSLEEFINATRAWHAENKGSEVVTPDLAQLTLTNSDLSTNQESDFETSAKLQIPNIERTIIPTCFGFL